MCSCVISLLYFENVQLAPISFNQSFMIWLPLPLWLLQPCAPAIQASVLFLKHAKNFSASDPWCFLWIQCHLFSEVFPELPSPTLPAFLILSPYFLFSKALTTTSKTAHLFYAFIYCLPLPPEYRLHEIRGFCPFYSILFLAPRKKSGTYWLLRAC